MWDSLGRRLKVGGYKMVDVWFHTNNVNSNSTAPATMPSK